MERRAHETVAGHCHRFSSGCAYCVFCAHGYQALCGPAPYRLPALCGVLPQQRVGYALERRIGALRHGRRDGAAQHLPVLLKHFLGHF